MKQKVRHEDGHKTAIFKCGICGLTDISISKLEEVDIDIDLPTFEVGAPALGFNEICSNCKDAIIESVWNNLIQLPVKHRNTLMGLDIHKYVKKFVKENKETLKDIASDYIRCVHVVDYVQTRLAEMQEKNSASESITEGLPVPTTKMIYDFMQECNNNENNINGSSQLKCKLDAGMEPIGEDNVHLFLSPAMKHVAKERNDLCAVRLTIKIELLYEEEVEVVLGFICVNETISKNKKSEDKGDLFKVQNGKHNNTLLNDAFGTDTDLGNFKID